MSSRLSFVVNGQRPGNRDKIVRFVREAQPTTITIMDGLAFSKQLAGLSPDTVVIHRDYETYRGDDDLYKKITPEDWIDQQTGIREMNQAMHVWAYAGNEQPFSSEVIAWNLRALRQAERRGLKLVVGNWGVGKPEDITQWSLAAELLRYLGEHPQTGVLGLHEYWWAVCTSGFVGGNPDGTVQGKPELIVHPDFIRDWPKNPRELGALWHCGRFLFAEKYCRDNYIPLPRIIVTEHGADDVSDSNMEKWIAGLKLPLNRKLRDWKSCQEQWREWWPERSMERAYYEQLAYLDAELYAGTSVIGQQIFAFNPSWPHDVSGADELYDLILTGAANRPPAPLPEPAPEPTPIPVPLPPNDGAAIRAIIQRLENVRNECATIQTELGKLLEGMS